MPMPFALLPEFKPPSAPTTEAEKPVEPDPATTVVEAVEVIDPPMLEETLTPLDIFLLESVLQDRTLASVPGNDILIRPMNLGGWHKADIVDFYNLRRKIYAIAQKLRNEL